MTPKSRTQEIADLLRDEILRGQYRVGERLPSERDLAERFTVNRNVVRVALKKLEQLGVADIRPGGARVAPIEEASLDVVGHLLDLEHPPAPQLVAQVLEAYRGVAALAMRLGVERASDEELARALELIRRVSAAGTPPDEQHQAELALNQIFVDASQNLVLKLLRRGISTQFIGRLHSDGLLLRPSREVMAPHVRALARAIETRDGAAAADALTAGMQLIHEQVLSSLRASLAQAGSGARRG